MAPERYLFDLAIYRISEKKFIERYSADLERYYDSTWPGQGRNAVPQELQESVDGHFWENYGMPWRFNQVVGWLRIYTLGSQVRGELWFTEATRLVRRRSPPPMRWRGKAFELHTFIEETSEEIFLNVRAEIEREIRALGRRRIVVDLECFENVAPRLDWKELLHGLRTDT